MPRLENPAPNRSLIWRLLRFLALVLAVSFPFAGTAKSQSPEETLSGPHSHETRQGPREHLLGTWGGERTRLEERGVIFDFQYVSDSLWNIERAQNNVPAQQLRQNARAIKPQRNTPEIGLVRF